ncbi:MAG TPA: fibronectin type III domain-containing protein [Xanthomonadaceae bacterium]|nr:fibronectin type III domain-containing protein [Xanthomonadaceae bacterium]
MNVLHSGTVAPLDNATIGVEMSLPLTTVVGNAPGRARIAVAFLTRSNDAALIVDSGRILTGMTGNPHYPAPVPALADIAAARNALIVAVNQVKAGTLAVVARRQLRAQLVPLLRSLGLYVQQTCNGDPAILLSSGYPMRKTRQPVGLLPAPANLRLARGTISGQLKARCKPVPQAGSYQWRYATAAAPTAWTQVETTLSASITLSGLVPGTQYVVQARAVGTQGPSDWSVASALMAV